MYYICCILGIARRYYSIVHRKTLCRQFLDSCVVRVSFLLLLEQQKMAKKVMSPFVNYTKQFWLVPQLFFEFEFSVLCTICRKDINHGRKFKMQKIQRLNHLLPISRQISSTYFLVSAVYNICIYQNFESEMKKSALTSSASFPPIVLCIIF